MALWKDANVGTIPAPTTPGVAPALAHPREPEKTNVASLSPEPARRPVQAPAPAPAHRDRKSTRLNSSHSQISYAVFCLKKKNKEHAIHQPVEAMLDLQDSRLARSRAVALSRHPQHFWIAIRREAPNQQRTNPVLHTHAH